jgi:type IV fimbrial biogenesis protein FimT
MHPITAQGQRAAGCVYRPVAARRQAGFTLIEALVAMAVMSILVALGVKRMQTWVVNSKATAAVEFYAEGFRLARLQAVGHNSASRITLDTNAKTGQMDWQVDICFPTPALPCTDTVGAWSTTTTAAAGDPEGTAGFKSVFRGADALPDTSKMTLTMTPTGNSDIYYTQLGWVNTAFAQRLQQVAIAPSTALAGTFPARALVVNLSGMVAKCEPAAVLHDSRRCPP